MIRWYSPQPLPTDVAQAFWSALHSMGEFEVTEGNFDRFLNELADLGALIVNGQAMADIARDAGMFGKVAKDLRRFIGFGWSWSSQSCE